MNARVEDSIIGRFISADPYIPDPSSAQEYNHYSSVDNNPLTYVDPSGFAADDLQAIFQPDGGDSGFSASGDPTPPYNFPSCDGSDLPCVTIRSSSTDPSAWWPTQGRSGGGSFLSGGPGAAAPAPSHPSPSPSNPPSSPQKDPSHRYVIKTPTTCPAPQAFDALKAPDVSAPGAPAAQEGHTEQVNLSGGNPISQDVNTPSMTIVNTTRPGHIFYPGTVTWQVSPMGTGSVINVTGEGTGAHAVLNDVVGILFFGMMSYFTQVGCDAANGIPTGQ